MSYTEVSFRIDPINPWRDILTAELGELGYESFEEDQDGLKAFIQTKQFKRSDLRTLFAPNDPHVSIDWTVRDVPDENWNAVWEEAFQPVLIDNRVLIRAEHHEANSNIEHDIVIQPRMAFGTGHHATTTMMVQAMMDVNMQDGTVCDLGCGTAVLAILAEQRGAASSLAVDYDQNAVSNAIENCARNACTTVVVEKGEVDHIKGMQFNVILANIQRNVLAAGMEVMRNALHENGVLLLSGFIQDDLAFMRNKVAEFGLTPYLELTNGEWALLGCKKE